MKVKFFFFIIFIIKLISCTHSTEKKIKFCNFTTHCPQAGKEFSVARENIDFVAKYFPESN